MARHAYPAAYHVVDIVLDTIPRPGGTTTCEALWMGVPMLTLVGDSLLARPSACLLTAGLPDWVATDKAGHFAQTVARAGDIDALSALRRGLRDRVSASPLINAPRFARHFEDALWQMWHQRQGKWPA